MTRNIHYQLHTLLFIIIYTFAYNSLISQESIPNSDTFKKVTLEIEKGVDTLSVKSYD